MLVKSPLSIKADVRAFLWSVLLCVVSVTSHAETIRYASHYGKSPFNFDEIAKPSDGFVVNDRDSTTLDRYMFRSSAEYEITIPILIKRFVGQDINKLVEKGLLSPTVKLHVPAFDVDSNSLPIFDCDGDRIVDYMNKEVNEVYFNDEFIGVLSGANNIWKFNDQFELNIEKVNFPAAPGGTGRNTIKVKIDVANKDVVLSSGQVGCRVWATEIDWAALEFEITSPLAFLPGMFGSPGSFNNSGFVDYLATETGLPSEILSHGLVDPSIFACLGRDPSFTTHAYEYREQLKTHAESYGSDGFHLVGHSKGGVDGRKLIQTLRDNPLEVEIGRMSGQPVVAELEAPSLATLGSLHKGTALADYIVAGIGVGNLLASDFCDLTTQNMANFNATVLTPSKVTTFNGAADADVNGDAMLDDVEVIGNQLSNPFADAAYKILRNIASVEIEFVDVPNVGPVTVPKLIRTTSPQPNDTMATVASATGLPGVDAIRTFLGAAGKNHGTILEDEVKAAVIDSGVSGALDWRLK